MNTPRRPAADAVHVSDVVESMRFIENYCQPQVAGMRTPPSSSAPVVTSMQPQSTFAQHSSAAPVQQASQVRRGTFLDALNILRARYAVDKSSEALVGLESMTEADIAALVECFERDVVAAVSTARARVGAAPLGSVHRSHGTPAEKGRPAPTPVTRVEPTSDLAVGAASIKNVRDAMTILRTGMQMIKFSSRSGAPSVRFVRVLDRRAVHDGEMVLMPHLCWALAEGEQPTNQLPLIDLQDVRTGPAKGVRKNADGYLVDVAGAPVADSRCFTAVFAQRNVDLAAPSRSSADLWVRCLLFVAEKNRDMQRDRKHTRR